MAAFLSRIVTIDQKRSENPRPSPVTICFKHIGISVFWLQCGVGHPQAPSPILLQNHCVKPPDQR